MYNDDDAGREERRRRFLRNLPWIIPAAMVVGALLFIGIGQVVVWLWRYTVVDIFGIKPITFWQAWALLLLAQFLFKANMQSTARTGYWQRHSRWRRDSAARPSEPAPGSPEGQ